MVAERVVARRRRVAGRREKEAVRTWRRLAASLDPAQEHSAARLAALTGVGWRILRITPHSDLVLVGPPGVFVVDIRPAGVTAADIDRLLHTTERIEETLAAVRLAPAAVTPLMVLTSSETNTRTGRAWLVGASAVLPALLGLAHRLNPSLIRTVADAVKEGAGRDQDELRLPDRGRDTGLIDVAATARAQVRGEFAAPVEPWMTLLHPDQLSLVRRHFGGPARISGAPGTGKTVVGLHRAAHLAVRMSTDSRVLYVSLARALPRVQATLFQRLAPGLVDRVEFASLHDWALKLLAERGHTLVLDTEGECFTAAWDRLGHGGALEQMEPDARYWRDEIAHVIKGRGVADLQSYLDIPRSGRRVPLQRPQRHAVWELYEAYEGIKKQRELVDHADLLLDALAEVRREPPAQRYASVIADEVQDFSLTAVRLLHALVGDAPDGLLLIGDARQAVYPVGFHLAEAQITIRGARSETLRRNYRNGAAILRTALQLAADDVAEDLDGTTLRGRPPVEVTVHEGRVVNVVARSDDDLDRALLGIVHDLTEVRTGGVAVLCARPRDVDRYSELLTRAGVALQSVDAYAGQPGPEVTIGTIHRCKGLEFSVVLLPRFDAAAEEARSGALTEADRVALANRQLYVAMTRARDLLWLGQVRRRAVSS